MANFIKKMLQKEFIRFLIVGGIVSVIDFAITGLIIYAFDSGNYNAFYEVFYKQSGNTWLNVIATGCGFTVGLLMNWVLSNFFVFKNNKKGKTPKGLLIFTVIALVGLGSHLFGMWLFNGVIGIQEFIVKIFMTCIVLIFNYFMRKRFIYGKEK